MTSAIILAGGLGTRLRDTVPELPKPMAPINGRPFLEHLMDYWISQGVDNFVLSIGYRHEIISAHFGNSYKNAKICYAIEETPLGTGGGLLLAVSRLKNHDACLVLNGDTFFEVSLKNFLNFHESRKSGFTFALFKTSETGRYMGMEVGKNGEIISLKSKATGAECMANGGVYLLSPDIFSKLSAKPGYKLSLEDDIFPAIMNAGGMLHGVECQGRFIDIGIPDDYFRASKILS